MPAPGAQKERRTTKRRPRPDTGLDTKSAGRGPPRRSLCRGPARLLSVGAGAPCVVARHSLRLEGPAGLCVGPPCFLSRSVSGPGGPLRGPALCGPGRSLCRGPALLASGPGALCRGSTSRPNDLCVRARRSLSVGPALCVGARRGDRRSLCRGLMYIDAC